MDVKQSAYQVLRRETAGLRGLDIEYSPNEDYAILNTISGESIQLTIAQALVWVRGYREGIGYLESCLRAEPPVTVHRKPVVDFRQGSMSLQTASKAPVQNGSGRVVDRKTGNGSTKTRVVKPKFETKTISVKPIRGTDCTLKQVGPSLFSLTWGDYTALSGTAKGCVNSLTEKLGSAS